MKIIYYYKDFDTPMYQWQHIHIFDELEHHGCIIDVFNPLDYENYDQANEQLIKLIEKCSYDLFMTPHASRELSVDTIKEIRRRGIPTLLICFDNLIVPFVHYDIAPFFDLVWLTSKETKPLFDKRGCNSVFLPYAANPYKKCGREEIEGIGFVGTPYGSRANMINQLTRNSISTYCHCKNTSYAQSTVKIESNMTKKEVFFELMKFKQGRHILKGAFVNHFKKDAELSDDEYLHLKNVVSPAELYMIYPRYFLTLSSTAARNTGVLKHPLNIVNLRSFEIPMSGGIQFCRYSPEIASYFKDGSEIVLYYSDEDMIEKAKFYLKNKRLRDNIRINARKCAEENHTWWKRFSCVFNILEIKKGNL